MFIISAAIALLSIIPAAMSIGTEQTPDDPPPACSFAVVGHRGTEDAVARNNTVAAFREAIAVGADVIEMDIRLTAPDAHGHSTWVINHNPSVEGHRISRTTFSDLRGLQPDLATFTEGARVVADAGLPIEVEVKPDRVSDSALRDALAVLSAVDLRLAAVVTSAHRSVLTELKPLAGPTQLGLIIRRSTSPESIKQVADRVLIRHNLVSAGYVVAAHAQGVAVEVWTVDDATGWQALSRYGVDRVITDKAAAVNAWCAGWSPIAAAL